MEKTSPPYGPIVAGAFTLIELLLVISIIAVLCALLLPSLKTARDSAKRMVCANQEKQIALSLGLYSSDYNGYLPASYDGSKIWVRYLEPYGIAYQKTAVHCPAILASCDSCWGSGMQLNYAYSHCDNEPVPYMKLATGSVSLYPPNNTFLLVDSVEIKSNGTATYRVIDGGASSTTVFPYPHKDGVNILWLDLHVNWLRRQDVSNLSSWLSPGLGIAAH